MSKNPFLQCFEDCCNMTQSYDPHSNVKQVSIFRATYQLLSTYMCVADACVPLNVNDKTRSMLTSAQTDDRFINFKLENDIGTYLVDYDSDVFNNDHFECLQLPHVVEFACLPDIFPVIDSTYMNEQIIWHYKHIMPTIEYNYFMYSDFSYRHSAIREKHNVSDTIEALHFVFIVSDSPYITSNSKWGIEVIPRSVMIPQHLNDTYRNNIKQYTHEIHTKTYLSVDNKWMSTVHADDLRSMAFWDNTDKRYNKETGPHHAMMGIPVAFGIVNVKEMIDNIWKPFALTTHLHTDTRNGPLPIAKQLDDLNKFKAKMAFNVYKYMSCVIDHKLPNEIRSKADLSDEWFGDVKKDDPCTKAECTNTIWNCLRQQCVTVGDTMTFIVRGDNPIMEFTKTPSRRRRAIYDLVPMLGQASTIRDTVLGGAQLVGNIRQIVQETLKLKKEIFGDGTSKGLSEESELIKKYLNENSQAENKEASAVAIRNDSNIDKMNKRINALVDTMQTVANNSYSHSSTSSGDLSTVYIRNSITGL